MKPVSDYGLIGMTPNTLRLLRDTLTRTGGEHAPEVLQEVGFNTGDEFYEAFGRWLRDRTGVDSADALDVSYLGEMLGTFFADLGWGTLRIETIGPSAMAIDTEEWIERSGPDDGDPLVCHFTTGLLAALLGRLAGNAVAVMEVAPPPDAPTTCRFLIGSPDTLQTVFDAMSQGMDYQQLLAGAGA